MARWRAGHSPGGLVFSDDGETLTIVDRRAGERECTGWRRDVYLYCDQSRPRARVEAHALERGAGVGQLRRFLTELVEARSMIELDGRLLSLAVRSNEDAEDGRLALSAIEERPGAS